MRKRNLVKIAAIGLPLLVGISCKSNIDSLNNFADSKTQIVKSGDRYWDYARQIRENCPKLSELDIRDVVEYLRDFNGRKPLSPSDEVKLPVYSDCGC